MGHRMSYFKSMSYQKFSNHLLSNVRTHDLHAYIIGREAAKRLYREYYVTNVDVYYAQCDTVEFKLALYPMIAYQSGRNGYNELFNEFLCITLLQNLGETRTGRTVLVILVILIIILVVFLYFSINKNKLSGNVSGRFY